MFKLTPTPDKRNALAQKVDALRETLPPVALQSDGLFKPYDCVLTYAGKAVAEMIVDYEWKLTTADLEEDHLPTPLLTFGMLYKLFGRHTLAYNPTEYYTLTPKHAPESNDAFKRDVFTAILAGTRRKISDYVIKPVTDFEICQIANEWLAPIKIKTYYHTKEVVWPDAAKPFQKTLNKNSLEILTEICAAFENQPVPEFGRETPTAEMVAKFQALYSYNLYCAGFWYNYRSKNPAETLNLRQVPEFPARIFTLNDINNGWISDKMRQTILERHRDGHLPNGAFWLHATGRTVDAFIPVIYMHDLATQLNLWLRLAQYPKLLTIEEKVELLPVSESKSED